MGNRKISLFYWCVLTLVYALGILGILASGGGGGSSSITPTISDLTISPSAIYVGEGGGQIDVSGTFGFSAPDDSLNATVINVLDDGGQIVFSETIVITGAEGLTSGILQGAVTIGTAIPGNFTVQIYITDVEGNQSNTLEASFLISEHPWISRAPMPTPRSGFATAVLDEKIYVIGGRDETAPTTPKPVSDVVEVYDPATNTWASAPSLVLARSNQMAISANGKVYAIGGTDDFETDTVQAFDLNTSTWSVKAIMPDQRSSGAVGTISGMIYVAGGGGLGLSQLAALLIYDPVNDLWSAGSPMVQAREGNGGTVINGQFLVYGGYYSLHVPDGGYLGSVESYNPVMDIWSPKAGGEPRRDFGVAVIDDSMYAFGGNNVARSLDLVSSYDPSIDEWSTKTPLPVSLGYVRAETMGSKVYAFETGNTFEYTPANDIR